MRPAVLLAIWTILGIATAHAQPAVVLEAVTDRKYYRESALNEVFVATRVIPTLPPTAPVASARNVALVLDRSGSMAGAPIEALRKAATAAVELLAAEDILSVIVFGSEVETLLEAQRREQAQEQAARIGQIEPAGGAALYDALNQAAAQLRRHAGPLTFNQIILVTDGPPTKGPREVVDFTKLAEVFAREGIIVTTIGLGPDFNEDMLATIAQIGGGRFRHVAEPAGLAAALRTELGVSRRVVGHDATLTIAFRKHSREVRAFDGHRPLITDATVSYSIARLLADQPLTVLAAAQIDAFASRFHVPDFATVRLRWKDAVSGEAREVSQVVALQFTSEGRDVRESLNADVARSMVEATVREGLQKAIEHLDKANPRAAARALRTARTEARDINFDLEDRRIEERIRPLDAFLLETQSRTLGPLDRKVMRAGLAGQFDPPAPIVEGKP